MQDERIGSEGEMGLREMEGSMSMDYGTRGEAHDAQEHERGDGTYFPPTRSSPLIVFYSKTTQQCRGSGSQVDGEARWGRLRKGDSSALRL